MKKLLCIDERYKHSKKDIQIKNEIKGKHIDRTFGN